MESSLLSQGLELMLAGMGTVFVFLTLLVGAMHMLARVAQRIAPDPVAAPVAPAAPAGSPSEAEVAAISAAIAVHRSTQQ